MADTAPPLCLEGSDIRAAVESLPLSLPPSLLSDAAEGASSTVGSKMHTVPSVMPPAIRPLSELPADHAIEEKRLAVLTLPRTRGVGLSFGLVMLKL